MPEVELQVSDANKKAIQEIILYSGQHYGIYKKTDVASAVEFRAVKLTELDNTNKYGLVAIRTAGMNGVLDLHTGILEVRDLKVVSGTSEQKWSLPAKIVSDKYNNPDLKIIDEGTKVDGNGRPEYYWQKYYDGNKDYFIRNLDLSKDIDFEGDKPPTLVNGPKTMENIEVRERQENIAAFLKTLPEGSKHTGISTEQKYGSTSYNFVSQGVPISYSSVDGEHFYVWASFGKKEVYTGESFKRDEIDDLKLDVQALKDKYQPKKVEKDNPAKETSFVPKDDRPYDISMVNIKKIDADGPISNRWGRYKGDRHEIFEAAVWAAKEAKVNPNHLVAFIEHESGFNPFTKSPTGAEGLGQFTSGTWNDIVNKYPVTRDGVKHNGLRDAYPELDWGKGTAHREDIVLNALATAHYMRYNMNQRDSDDRNVGYVSHNLGPGGCNQFMHNLKESPDSKCSGKALVVYNPINYTDHGVPLTYRQAYHRIDSHMNNSYGMAVQRGFNVEFANDALQKNQSKFAEEKPKEKDKTTSQISDDLKNQGVKEYSGNGFMPQEVMDKALALAQSQSRGGNSLVS